MTENHEFAQKRRDAYEKCMDEIDKREQSGLESFDKAVLTLSSAGLGISVTLLTDVIPLDRAVHVFTLYFSWVMFVAAMLCTLISFQVSVCALDAHKVLVNKYYLGGEDSALSAKNKFDEATHWFNRMSAITFVFALFSTLYFVIFNLEMNR